MLAVLLVAAFLAGGMLWQMRRRNLHKWIGAYVRQELRRGFRRRTGSPTGLDVFICIADHFEPHAGGADDAIADARVSAWTDCYADVLGEFRDSGGRPPRHTFFYPIDQYVPHHVDALTELCRDGYGEIEIQLHHDHDTAGNLESTLRRFTDLFASQHGLLGRLRSDQQIMYGFVHGNWALDNSRPDGRWCGVDDELGVLRRTGCYADFTFPSAPDVTQPRKINSIYYATGRPGRCKSHDSGIDVRAAKPHDDGLMIIQGPLRLRRAKGTWNLRIENGCLQRTQPPTADRLDEWLRAGVEVVGRSDWRFIKLHTHGAIEANRQVLLGQPVAGLHRELARRAALDGNFRYHYVTAREMYNLVKVAEAGIQIPITTARDFEIMPPFRMRDSITVSHAECRT